MDTPPTDWEPGDLRALLRATGVVRGLLILCGLLALVMATAFNVRGGDLTGVVAWHAGYAGVLLIAIRLNIVRERLGRRWSRQFIGFVGLFTVLLGLQPDTLLSLFVFWIDPVDPGLPVFVGHAILVGLCVTALARPVHALISSIEGPPGTVRADVLLVAAWVMWVAIKSLAGWHVLNDPPGGPGVYPWMDLFCVARAAQAVLIGCTAWRVWTLEVAIRQRQLCRFECPGCRYDLRGTPDTRCPECGWRRAA